MVTRVLAALLVCGIAGAYGAELSLTLNARLHEDEIPFWEVDKASPEHKQEMLALATAYKARLDTRDRNDVVNTLRVRGVDAVAAVRLEEFDLARLGSSGGGRLAPIGGVSNRLTVLCNESGPYITYVSDEYGFRNPRGIWRSPRADLAIVGESFAQGDCVPEGRGFGDLLRADYPVTLNLGFSGQGALLQLAALREYLQFRSPKVVLWVFCEGIDLPVLQHTEAQLPLLRRYLEPGFTQHLIERQPEVDTAVERYLLETAQLDRRPMAPGRVGPWASDAFGVLKLWQVRGWLSDTYRERYSDDALLGEPNLRLLGQTLRIARDLTTGWGGTLYFVYLPSWNRYRNDSVADDQERSTVFNVARSLQIPVIDVEPAFQAHGDPLALFPFRRFGHYNEAGHQVVADALRRGLSVRRGTVMTARRTAQSPN